MAIQNRRGQYIDFDQSKLVPGEWAVVTSGDPNAEDGKAVYMCFEPGNTKRMATYEDIPDYVAETIAHDAVEQEVQEQVGTILDDCVEATGDASSAATAAQTATTNAQAATTAANNAADAANTAASVISSLIGTPVTTYLTRATDYKLIDDTWKAITVPESITLNANYNYFFFIWFSISCNTSALEDGIVTVKVMNGGSSFPSASNSNMFTVPVVGNSSMNSYLQASFFVEKSSTARTISLQLQARVNVLGSSSVYYYPFGNLSVKYIPII